MDKTSLLSDDLLIKILSLLTTKDVVTMSFVCKRWKSLWILVSRLIFGEYPEDREDEDTDPESDENYFKNMSQFVNGTLLLHKAPFLECFHLNRASGCSSSEIHLWVRIAIERFVRDLKIGFCYEYGRISLPSTLFRCVTLEALELKKVILLEFPSDITFPSLKTLVLLFVTYADEESFVRLISNCPVLEDLVVETCHDDNVETFTINVLSLESLSIRNTLQESETENDLFVVHYHSLKQFTIVDYFGQLNLIGTTPKLVEANLLSVSCHAKVLESFTCVKCLSICLPEELVRLEICLCDCNWTNVLVSVLQYSPKLQVLKLALKHSMSEDRKVCWIQPVCVAECLLYHLKTFEWRDYEGTELEKQVAVYILKNARRLVTATIYPYDSDDELVRKHQMFEELESASRGLRACELTMWLSIYQCFKSCF